jgi:hypothetical protein
MLRKVLVSFVLLLPVSLALAGDNALFRGSNQCNKYPPSDARAECKKQEREDSAAFDKARQLENATSKSAETGKPKNQGLCFTRLATGEQVCPN